MNKFAQNLTKNNKQIKESRAKRVAEQAKMAQEDVVRTLRTETMDLEAKLEDLEDLSPDSTMSLNPVKGEFDAKEWVNKIQSIKIELANKTIEYKIAKETFDSYFTEEETK